MADALKAAGVEKKSNGESEKLTTAPEQLVTPEEIDASVDGAAAEAIREAPPKETEINLIQNEYRKSVTVEASPTPQEVGQVSRRVQEIIGQGGKVVGLPDKTTVAVFEQPEGGVRIKKLEVKKRELGSRTPPAVEAVGPKEAGYEAELARLKQKQAELRAAGRGSEAAAYDEGIAKYEQWKRAQPASKEPPPVTPSPASTIEVPVSKVEKGPDFSLAQTFEELRAMLIDAGKIVGRAGTTYEANDLIGNITDIRDTVRASGGNLGELPKSLDAITTSGGLRAKVGELLLKEIVELQATSQKASHEPSADESLAVLREAHEGTPPAPQPPVEREPQEDVLDVLREGQTGAVSEEQLQRRPMITPEEQAALNAAYEQTIRERQQGGSGPGSPEIPPAPPQGPEQSPEGPQPRREFEPLAEMLQSFWDQSKTKYRLDTLWDKSLAHVFNYVAKRRVGVLRWNTMRYERHKDRVKRMEEKAKAGRTNFKKFLGLPEIFEWRAKRARKKMLASYERVKHHDGLRRKWETKRNHRCQEIADLIDVRLRPHVEKVKDCAELVKDAAHMLKQLDTQREQLTNELAEVTTEGQRMGKLFGMVMDKETRNRVDVLKGRLDGLKVSIREKYAVMEKMNARRTRAGHKADGWRVRKERVQEFGRNVGREDFTEPTQDWMDQTKSRAQDAA